MPQSTVSPFRISHAQSAISVESASSLLISSDSESVLKDRIDCASSLGNGFGSSLSALTQPAMKNSENERRLRAVSLDEAPPLLLTDSKQKSKSGKSDELSLPSVDEGEKNMNDEQEGNQQKYSSSKPDDTSSQGCGAFLKRRKYKKLDGDGEHKSKMTARQILLLFVLCLATLSSSFAICLFPPFFPKIAEEKGATASVYGFIIGTNCLASFIITPFVGKNLKVIGVRFAFVSGVFVGGVCCLLSGFLADFPAGTSFIVISIFIRIIHAAGNAGAITSTFTYTAVEFPNSVAKIFSLTRTMMNIAQLAGPIAGGALYEWGGFKMPFLLMGGLQSVMAFAVFPFLPDYDASEYESGSSKSTSSLSMLCIPTIWIPFLTFVVSTMSNGFLSINLEPQVLRKFGLSYIYVGVFFGLKDGFNSLASPIWGYLCDRRGSVKLCLIVSTFLGALSIFLLGPFPNLAVVGVALALSGVSFAGQQVSGVVDAMREAVNAGYPDSPSTHGLVAGLWSSLSGAGRFVSRSGTGILVDHIGFQMTAVIVFTIQVLVGTLTFWCTMPRCRRRREVDEEELDTASIRSVSFTYSVLDIDENPRLTITQPESPTDSVTCKSLSIPLPRDCDVVRRLRAETYAGSTSK